MSTTVLVLLFLVGLSESAGRVLPLVAFRPKLSPQVVVGLMVTGAVVEGTVVALWPLAAWIVSDLVQQIVPPGEAGLSGTAGLAWTPALVAPLLLAAVLAFPLLGPSLHILLVAGVGAGLAGPLAGASGLDWWPAAGCIAIARVWLAVTFEVIRRLIARIIAGSRRPEVIV